MQAESLTVEAQYTHREGVEGWSGLVFTLQEGISYYMPLMFEEQKYGSEVRSRAIRICCSKQKAPTRIGQGFSSNKLSELISVVQLCNVGHVFL